MNMPEMKKNAESSNRRIEYYSESDYYELCGDFNRIVEINIQLNEEIRRREKKETDLQDELLQLKNRIQKAESELSDEKEKVLSLTSKNESCMQFVDELQVKNHELNSELLAHSTALKEIYGSRSWRITAPFRKITGFLRRIINIITSFKFRLGAKAQSEKRSAIYARNRDLINGSALQLEETLKVIYQEAEVDSIDVFLSVCKEKGWIVENNNTYTTETSRYSLLISHELNLTGAPIALEYLAETLIGKGLTPIVISPKDGVLRERLLQDGVTVIVGESVFKDDIIPKASDLFDLIVACTIISAPLVAKLGGRKTPVIWWIHEAVASYHIGALSEMPEHLWNNIHVFCAGNYAKKVLENYRPEYKSEVLLYRVPDYAEKSFICSCPLTDKIEDKRVFACIGTLEERKGQDVLIDAIHLLSSDEIRASYFVFVGNKYNERIWQKLCELIREYPDNIVYFEQLSREEIMGLYSQIDYLVCSSRDDPMPIVVTEAQMYGKAVICSENTGSAGIIRECGSGVVYKDNNSNELSGYLSLAINGHLDSCYADNARRFYEDFFSDKVFDKSVERILNTLEKNEHYFVQGKVSVIIPTYNGEDDLSVLIPALKNQKFVKELEIVIVDSGSSDGSVNISEKYDCIIVEIDNSQFSHSYARNLGAAHSTGEYLLFMTQDALPSNEYWISDFVYSLECGNSVAASCVEVPKQDCDLLGGMSNWVHLKYMDVVDKNRLMVYPSVVNADSIRKNGQLNDVACLIKRSVFLNYKYRGDYAEDLDLGIRLIKDGYKLCLLSSVKVIHSHNRTCFYHLKRAVVDIINLNRILFDLPVREIDEDRYVNGMITGFITASLFTDKLLSTKKCYDSITAFTAWTEKEIRELAQNIHSLSISQIKRTVTEKNIFIDESTVEYVINALTKQSDRFEADMLMIDDQIYAINNNLMTYLGNNGILPDEINKVAIAEFVMKNFAQLAGIYLGYYYLSHKGEHSFLHDVVNELTVGV